MIMMNNRKAFTMVELLTVVVIIALLLGILLPSISAIRAKAKETAQKAQLGIISIGLEAFKQDYGDYPRSTWNGLYGPDAYSGAQKLAEALVGWDLMGFHPKTAWRADGLTGTGPYGVSTPGVTEFSYDPGYTRRVPPITGLPETLNERKNPYIDVATANAFKISELYNKLGLLNTYVLCDVYHVRKLTDKAGKTVFAGSPILYYKANTLNKTIDANYTATPVVLPQTYSDRIYDYYDNELITSYAKFTVNGDLSVLWHPLCYIEKNGEHTVFYGDQTRYNPTKTPPFSPPGSSYGGSGVGSGIRDPRIGNPARPYNPDSYILISAGPDGYYGTTDDIHNF
jgi:prepilin-type N-terminal cleavage/methylation domain-containing protein